MRKLVHDKDLKLYSVFCDGVNINNPLVRVDAFYDWARAKGYKTHQHLLVKVNENQSLLCHFDSEKRKV